MIQPLQNVNFKGLICLQSGQGKLAINTDAVVTAHEDTDNKLSVKLRDGCTLKLENLPIDMFVKKFNDAQAQSPFRK